MSTPFEVPGGVETESGLSLDSLFGDRDQPFQIEPLESMGTNPFDSTEAKPGSRDKVAMLAARYAAGLPLWHDGDCIDHGSGRSLFDLDV